MEKVKQGDIVSVIYTGKLENGEIFDSTEQKQPLYFKVGDGEVLQVFEESVVGMEVGESKSIDIDPKNAYGEYDEKNFLNVKKEDFPNDTELYVGMQFYYKDPNGNTAFAFVDSINGDDVKMNFNHPLAGHTLHFDFTILSVNEITEDELIQMYSQDNGGCEGCGGGCGGGSCDEEGGCGCGGCGCN